MEASLGVTGALGKRRKKGDGSTRSPLAGWNAYKSSSDVFEVFDESTSATSNNSASNFGSFSPLASKDKILPSRSTKIAVGMAADIQQAIDIGLDQICLYHLVMFRGLGTVWSRDTALLSTLPTNDEAAENWLVLREYLIDRGFRQTSLTNFERAELATDPRRYRYEQISYESDHCQVLGFGPAGISYSSSEYGKYALKTMNPESSAEYLQAVRSLGPTWNRHFQYTPHNVQLLHLTRRLAALRIDKETLSQIHGSSAWDRYAERFHLLVAEGLLQEGQQDYVLKPRGMFYSDSCAALLADSRRQNYGDLPLITAAANDNRSGYI